ncbi:hypothetical protein AB0D54_22835 [Streptomyces xanthophaeus]|uniref:hypothetical protein n=1 Tax=Streptomyces xanthophaeus TaxID=67385 RepID=UPI003418DE80
MAPVRPARPGPPAERRAARPTPTLHTPLDESVLEAVLEAVREAATATRQKPPHPAPSHDTPEVPAMATPIDADPDTAADAHEQPPQDSMPLWHNSPEPPDDAAGRPQDEDVWAAWDEICNGVPAAEVRAAVAPDVAVLNPPAHASAADEPPTPAWAPVEPPAASALPDVAEAAAAVDRATAAADSHAGHLADHPEWHRIQTVRGSLRHVWDVMKEKAGSAWENLRADARFQGFWRTMSVRACETISVQAAALANRLGPGTGDLPTADALLKLSGATLNYSTAASAPQATGQTPVPAGQGDAAPVPMQRLAEQPTPTAYATREDAARAAAEVTAHFQTWITTPMGQELAESGHRRVTDLRNAWQQLPPHESGPGPAVGPYGSVAERAQDLVTAAADSGRFTPADLQALHALARAADHHAARLAVTLPPGTARTAPRTAAVTPAVASPPPTETRSTPGLSA